MRNDRNRSQEGDDMDCIIELGISTTFVFVAAGILIYKIKNHSK